MTGGSIARANADGHRVVLVFATNGDHGEVPDDLAAGESLVERRRKEAAASAEVLGVQRVEWLGYSDSGMTGWEQNGEPGSFHQADIGVVAERVAEILREESADVLTIYDWHGNYGHPDHVKVHQVGVEAARLVPAVRVAESTMNRDKIVSMIESAAAAGITMDSPDGEETEFDPNGPADDGNPMGTPEAEITLVVDVGEFVDLKKQALMCHRSQISDTSFFLRMPEEAFATMFGAEYFIEHDAKPPMRTGWFFSEDAPG